jgi:hypothetical protein
LPRHAVPCLTLFEPNQRYNVKPFHTIFTVLDTLLAQLNPIFLSSYLYYCL